MKHGWRSWAIFLGSVIYAIVGFTLYWTRGPADLSFAFAGMVALPAVYGWLWKFVVGGNGEIGCERSSRQAFGMQLFFFSSSPTTRP